MSASLVGSEMCIRDSFAEWAQRHERLTRLGRLVRPLRGPPSPLSPLSGCLLYTSDAADDM
eukprot:5711079-Alexandrium_andersonii.AAC.1